MELLVVLLIIGILMAIAIPTYLTVVKSANNTAATSNLQTADTAADVYYTQNAASCTGLLTPGGPVSDLSQQGSGLVYGTALTDTVFGDDDAIQGGDVQLGGGVKTGCRPPVGLGLDTSAPSGFVSQK